MSEYNVEFRAKDGVLYVHLSGEFPREMLDKSENLFQPLADACAVHQCDKAFIDARELKANLGTLGLFRAGEETVPLTRAGLRIALLAREDMVDRFFEDVAANRGGTVKVFTDPDAAYNWLTR